MLTGGRSTLDVPSCARSSVAAGGSPPRFPGFEPRAEQAALAQEVADALERGEHLLAEAGTGIGKSLAYLIPALESGKRVVVADGDEGAPGAAPDQGRPGRRGRARTRGRRRRPQGPPELPLPQEPAHARPAALPHGRGRRRVRAAPGLDRDDGERRPGRAPLRAAADPLGRGRGRARTGARGSAAPSSPPASRSRRVPGRRKPSSSSPTTRSTSPTWRSAPRPAPGRESCRSTTRSSSTRPTAWRRARRRGSAGVCRSAGSRQLLRDVERACREAGSAVPARSLDAIDRRGEELLAGLDPGRGRRRLTEADAEAASAPAAALAAALVQLAEALRGRGEDLDQVARRALATVDDLGACLAVDDEDSVSWAEQGALAWAPIDVSDTLREILWERDVVSDPRLGHPRAPLSPRPAGARRGAGGLAPLAVRLPGAGPPLRAARLPRAARGRLRRSGSPRRSSRSAGSPRAARSCSPPPTASSTSSPTGGAAHPVSRADPGRRAARAAARALP